MDLDIHLDRRHANAAGAALDQQGLARLQARTVEDIAPDREKRLWQGRGLHIIQTCRNRQALAHGCHAQLGVATTGHQCTDAVAGLEARSGHGLRVTRLDHAGHFEARDV